MPSGSVERGVSDYAADLHLHSVLSPCADLEMSPAAIVGGATAKGLSLIALTDHTAAENGLALRDAAARAGLAILYGLEIRSEEEVDVLCLFDDLNQAMALQRTAYAALPVVRNDPLLFGDQVVVDAEDRILRTETRLLINAVALPLRRVVERAHGGGGLAIPAHVDRRANSLTSQLGFPPAGCAFDAMELSPFVTDTDALARHPWLGGYPVVRFSDAHTLGDIGRQRTSFRICTPTVQELRLAFRGERGRGCAGVRKESRGAGA